MSVFPCSICKRRLPGKLATAYWAWFDQDGGRSAWKLRYCLEDAMQHLSVILQPSEVLNGSLEVFACVSCGADAKEDSDPLYCTLYLPGKEPTEYALQVCTACAGKLRPPLIENGERLPDRGGVVRGPSPSITAWDALGLSPSKSL